jgi:hypothetical protein
MPRIDNTYKGKELDLIFALANGKSVRGAATQTGLSARTVARRLNEPEFQKAVTKARNDMMAQAAGVLAATAAAAAIRAGQLLQSENEMVAISAARLILSEMTKLSEYLNIDAQVEAIEEQLHSMGARTYSLN